MASLHSSVYKSAKFSDVKVRILQKVPAITDDMGTAEPPTKRTCSPSRGRKNGASPSQPTTKVANGGTWTDERNYRSSVVVEEFPGHKLVFFAASDCFKALLEWSDIDAITLEVDEYQVIAAQAMVYYIHHFKLMDGLQMCDVANLLILADKYQLPKCVADCAQCLEATMDRGKNLDATLGVCEMLRPLGEVASPLVQDLFQHFQKHAGEFQKNLQPLVAAATADVGGAAASQEQSSVFERAVAMLRWMFQDMDQVWGQERYRSILHMFPAEVVKGLLEWDGLAPVSENVVVSAITCWLEAQPAGAVTAKQEEALLQVVRFPHLSPSYMSLVFPELSWVQRHGKLTKGMIAYGT
jgi:hypothetical protein